ncbi:MAG: serine hydrolase [Acidobacteriota bacterium]
MLVRTLSLTALIAALTAFDTSAQCTYPTPVTPATCTAAKQYNASTGGVSLLVWVNGQNVCEAYNSGSGPNVAHEAWSGTKSFWSIVAARAIQDGLISSLDEKLVDTIPEWQSDPWKSQITVRQLLSLTSGIRAEAAGGGTPTYAAAINEQALYAPGTFWEYGSVPYQIFGEFMRRKLQPNYVDPLAYLDAKVLSKIDAQYTGWTRGTDNMPNLPWGSQWTPQEWIRYGELVRRGGFWPATGEQIVDQELMDDSFHRSAVKDTYGLTWWLPEPGNPRKSCDAVMAFGLGSQKLYVIRSLKLVAVRQTDEPWDGLTFSDDEFLDRLLAPSNPQDDCAPVTSTALTMTKSGNDIAFDWSPVNTDSTGNTELIGGYEARSSTKPTVALPLPAVSTAGPRSAALVPGDALGVAEIAY